MNKMEMMLNNNSFVELCLDEVEVINGGATVADYAAAIGGVYSAVVSCGSLGWLGATAATVCSAPLVAGSAAVVGVLCAGYGIYTLFK